MLEAFWEEIMAAVSNWNRVTLMRCKNDFYKIKKIILPVASSGVIRKITFEIQYNFRGLDHFV